MKKIYKILGIIPARGGSRKIYKKNIKILAGKPLIAYTIKTVEKAKIIDRCIVSTDDKQVARVARKWGGYVPFMRPAFLAKDSTPDHPVLVHTIRQLQKRDGYLPEIVVMLRPTSPLKTPAIINDAVKRLIENPKYTSVRTVCKAEGVFHPYWMFRNKKGTLFSFIKGVDIVKYYQRQLLPECFRINGVVDVLRTSVILNSDNPYGNKVGFLEIDPYNAIDIDQKMDFKLCEFLIKTRKKR